MFPFEDFFIQGNQKKKKKERKKLKSHLCWNRVNEWIGRIGQRVHDIFGQNLLNTQCGVARCARKTPVVKWANALKVFKNIPLKPDASSHNNASWYTDADGFLEHSRSGGSLYYKGPTLQKIILLILGSPLYVCIFVCVGLSDSPSYMCMLFFIVSA